ncbi:hypothetical protein DES53_115127 [Roseimicrobium gellanilyticum]|uniref:Uncharacterized protein n=1 Tax=Roseimicrobium gellanilyticum TaxID=748857 RepID=A0A366H6U9_9BACT|nr:hypothetical protein [Roseimicrobium gellanilyticum]RBP36986.1 hypothetical protein DES53_115127 [Roseimicrobium gellanilyticum]
MSRRTKLIIAASLLVLLAIPVTYVVLAWRLEDPLRFHVVGERMEYMPAYAEELRVLAVEVENTSAVTVGIRRAYLGEAAATAKPMILGGMDTLIITYESPPPVIIPAHRKILRKFLVEEGVPMDKPLHEFSVKYTWNSRMAIQADALVLWLWKVLPSDIGGKLKRPARQYGQALLAAPP